jgi:hypothetical protein
MSITIRPGMLVPKDPEDREVFVFDFTDNLPSGASISTKTLGAVALQPPTAHALTLDQDSNTTTTVTVRVSGGKLGSVYRVWCQIVTDESVPRTRRKSFRLEIKEQ